MQKLLQEISKKVILLNEYDFTEKQIQSEWLGEGPVSNEEINRAKAKLQIDLPEDYIEFLKISNGFHQCSATGTTFLPIDKIDFLINVDDFLVEIWNDIDELADIGKALSESILIGGLNEEQYFLLIPPDSVVKEWRYWKFASWIPGEQEFKNLNDYFKKELSWLKEETKGLKKQKPKFVVDYSLRDHVFNQDWENVFSTALKFLRENKWYGYFNGHGDLLSLLLFSSYQKNRFDEFSKFLLEYKLIHQENQGMLQLISRYENAIEEKTGYIPELDSYRLVYHENPMTLDQIEEQIATNRLDLLRSKSAVEKVEYQLYFLFKYGDPKDLVSLYDANKEKNLLYGHIKAAIAHASLKDKEKSLEALERYFEISFDYRPIDPFLNNTLIQYIDKDFSQRILQKMTQK